VITAGPTTPGVYGLAGVFIQLAGLNSANQTLLGTSYPNVQYDALVYNAVTHTLTDLGSLLRGNLASSYVNPVPIAIDDQGRILLRVGVFPGKTFDTLLLTPEGVSSDPLPLSTPEPGTLAIWGLVSGVVAVRLARRRTGRLA
jgi:hypothetical protein